MLFKKKPQIKPSDPGIIVGTGKAGAKKWRKLPKLMKVVSLLVIAGLLIAGGIAGFSLLESRRYDNELSDVNKYVRENNTSQALVHAKRALDLDPNNVDAILAVANLTLKDNPEESKQYFAHALELYKKENNPDADGKTAINYWAAAGFAEQAGFIDQAKKYYQKVIDAANPSDSYHQSLVKQSQDALKRLL